MKYLNGVLTIIAACLVLLTAAVTGIIPTANAKNSPAARTLAVPVNPDGSITVRFAPNAIQDVNIKEVGGSSTYGKLNVNIEEVDGSSVSRSVPVKISQ